MLRRLPLILLVMLIPVAAAATPGFHKLPASEVPPGSVQRAQQIATALFNGWSAGRYQALGNAATPEMRRALTPELQRSSWEDIRGVFGSFRSMRHVETWAPDGGSPLRIHRFRARFTAEAQPEVRVVLDASGRLAGIFVKPWSANLQ